MYVSNNDVMNIYHCKICACLLPGLILVKHGSHKITKQQKFGWDAADGYQVFLRRWGLPYLFSLEGAVHGEDFAESSDKLGSLQCFRLVTPGVNVLKNDKSSKITNSGI